MNAERAGFITGCIIAGVSLCIGAFVAYVKFMAWWHIAFGHACQ